MLRSCRYSAQPRRRRPDIDQACYRWSTPDANDEGPPIIKRETDSVQPIIVEATTAFAKANKVDIVRCDGDPDDPAKSKGKESVFQFFAPIGGINAVRMGHGAAVLREIRDTYCNGSQNFFHFYLLDTEEHVVPLNWTVSKTMASYIWDTAMKEEGNQNQYEKLKELLERRRHNGEVGTHGPDR
jgi:hypothetical protein